MPWEMVSAEHRVTVLVKITGIGPVLPRGDATEFFPERVQLEYYDGQSKHGRAGVPVFGRRAMPDGRPKQGRPTVAFLRFADYPWLEDIRQAIDGAYCIPRSYDDADPVHPGAPDGRTSAA